MSPHDGYDRDSSCQLPDHWPTRPGARIIWNAQESPRDEQSTDDGFTGAAVLMPTIIYLGGMSRSGSTLAERLLGELPGACPAGEVVHMWRRGVLADEHCGCGELFSGCSFWQKVGEAGFGGWGKVDVGRFEELQRRVDRTRFIPLLAAPALMPAAFRRALDEYLSYYQRLYTAIGEITGCHTVVDSSKHASLAFCLARSQLSVRIVHVVRDPRGVAHSWTKRVSRDVIAGTYMRTQVPARTALQWDTQNAGMDLLASTGFPVLRVRYEDLVAAPQAALREIAAFAGLFRPAGLASWAATAAASGLILVSRTPCQVTGCDSPPAGSRSAETTPGGPPWPRAHGCACPCWRFPGWPATATSGPPRPRRSGARTGR